MAAMQESFDRHFFTPVAAMRLLLVEKCVLVLLALDMWFVRIGAANRYDADDLNLAHFDWLDAAMYDLTIDTDHLSPDRAADIIVTAAQAAP